MTPVKPTKEYLEAVRHKILEDRKRLFNPAKRYLEGVSNLPPAPMLMTELLALFRNPDHDVDQVVQLISYEPPLTAQILRNCNSAYFGGDQPCGDMFEAVSRVGFYQVYCLVVSLYGSKTKSMEGADKGINVEELWRHSVAAAVSASTVAEDSGKPKAVAFTAGLLHDIGKLVLASVERERYAQLIAQARTEGVSLTGLENTAFATDHAKLGGELMERWKLPAEIVAAVRDHHGLEIAPPHAQLTAAVQIGDQIAHQLMEENLAETDLAPSLAPALDVLRFSAEDVPRLLLKSQAEMEKVKGMLEI
jgi:putative nucleotidyltransferase with HDIG domain